MSACTPSQVSVGNLIETPFGFERVYFQGHASPLAAQYVRLVLETNHSLELTPDHYLPLVDEAGTHERYILAKDAHVGMQLSVVDAQLGSRECYGNAQSKGDSCGIGTAVIQKVERVALSGLFNPYTESGLIIVNGVVASSHSSWFLEDSLPASVTPLIYQKLLAPIRALHTIAPNFVKAFCDKHIAEAPERPLSALGVTDIVRSVVSLAVTQTLG